MTPQEKNIVKVVVAFFAVTITIKLIDAAYLRYVKDKIVKA